MGFLDNLKRKPIVEQPIQRVQQPNPQVQQPIQQIPQPPIQPMVQQPQLMEVQVQDTPEQIVQEPVQEQPKQPIKVQPLPKPEYEVYNDEKEDEPEESVEEPPVKRGPGRPSTRYEEPVEDIEPEPHFEHQDSPSDVRESELLPQPENKLNDILISLDKRIKNIESYLFRSTN